MTILPTCKHHQHITQCQFNDMNIAGQGIKGRGFGLARHKISHLSQWS